MNVFKMTQISNRMCCGWRQVAERIRWKVYSERVQIPAKAIADFLTVTLRRVTLQFANMIQRASVNSHRFTECCDRYFHIPLPIVTKHELGLPFPLGTFA